MLRYISPVRTLHGKRKSASFCITTTRFFTTFCDLKLCMQFVVGNSSESCKFVLFNCGCWPPQPTTSQSCLFSKVELHSPVLFSPYHKVQKILSSFSRRPLLPFSCRNISNYIRINLSLNQAHVQSAHFQVLHSATRSELASVELSRSSVDGTHGVIQ